MTPRQNGAPRHVVILGWLFVIGNIYGLLTRKAWARVVAIVVAVLGLLNVPIGTLIGIYALWVLFSGSVEAYFEVPAAAGGYAS
jgi:hypothetical protein